MKDKYFLTLKKRLSGTNFKEIRKEADAVYEIIRKRTKRTPYIKSKYFKKEKVFLNIFWKHLFEKSEKDRVRRLRYYECGLDLIASSVRNPESYDNFKNKNELLHRFYGITKNKEKFVVQIKENKRTKRKDLISIFPE